MRPRIDVVDWGGAVGGASDAAAGIAIVIGVLLCVGIWVALVVRERRWQSGRSAALGAATIVADDAHKTLAELRSGGLSWEAFTARAGEIVQRESGERAEHLALAKIARGAITVRVFAGGAAKDYWTFTQRAGEWQLAGRLAAERYTG